MSRYDMIKGIIPPIITPMNEDESFNEAEFRNQIERQIAAPVKIVKHIRHAEHLLHP